MKKPLLISLLVAFAFSCAKNSDEATDKANFVRIYDNEKFSASFYPIDIKQTPDGGFLILGERKLADSTAQARDLSAPNFSGTYILKVDQFGAFVSQQELGADKVNPIGPLLEANSKYYFFAMKPDTQTQLLEMDADGTITKTSSVGGSYPAAAFIDDGNFLLLRYDNFSKQSVVSIVSPTGAVSKSKGFSVGAGDGVEGPIIKHFLRTGRQFPFLVGKVANNQYFFNGFYNYTFSLVFTDLTGDTPQGVVQGQQTDGGFSSAMLLDGNRFAASLFNFNDNYFLPSITLNTSSTTGSITKLDGNPTLELAANATIKIIAATVNSKETLLYGTTTRNKQIVIYGYDKATGKFLGSRYLGFSNPFEIAAMTTTIDGGLAVCGTTYVAGRFPRICLFKISKDELAKSFK